MLLLPLRVSCEGTNNNNNNNMNKNKNDEFASLRNESALLELRFLEAQLLKYVSQHHLPPPKWHEATIHLTPARAKSLKKV